MWEQYRLVGSIEEAVCALSEIGGEARIIAGGTDLILEIERGVRKGIKTLIDISAIPGFTAYSGKDLCIVTGMLGSRVSPNPESRYCCRQPRHGITRQRQHQSINGIRYKALPGIKTR